MQCVGKCNFCALDLLASPISATESSWIASRNYTGQYIFGPETLFFKLFMECSQVLDYFMGTLCIENKIKLKLKIKLEKHV